MMEPVAYLYTGGGREPEASVRKFQDITIWAHMRKECPLVPQSALSDAEARIAELEAALDEKEIASGLTSDGNLWRYWSNIAKGLALKNADLIRERDAAEALLKEAGKRLAWATKIIRSYVERDENDGVVLGQDFARLDTAKEFLEKIGVKDE